MPADSPKHPERKPDWLHTNRGAAAGMSVVFLILLLYVTFGQDAFRELRDGFRLGFFPILGAGLCLLFALIMLFDRFRDEYIPELEDLNWKSFGFVVGALVWSYVFFQFVLAIGFLFSAPVYLFALLYVTGLRPLHSVIVAALVISAAVFAAFWAVGITLPALPAGMLGG